MKLKKERFRVVNILDAVEQRVLFRVIRVATFLAVVFLSFGAGYGIKTLYENHSSTYVSIADVKEAFAPGEVSATQNQSGVGKPLTDAELEALGISKIALMNFADDDNRKVLSDWLDTIPTTKAKRDFIANLNEIVSQAPTDGEKSVSDYINKFKDLKLDKVRSNQFGEYADAAKLGATVLFVMLTIALIGLFSLVLVLLAIERNTRKAPTQPVDATATLAAPQPAPVP